MASARLTVVWTAVAAAGLSLSGCGAPGSQPEVSAAPEPPPTASASPTAAPTADAVAFEQHYSGGTAKDHEGEYDWHAYASQAVAAAAARERVAISTISSNPAEPYVLEIEIKGDPTDADLVERVETGVVPAALEWATDVTVRIGPDFDNILAVYDETA